MCELIAEEAIILDTTAEFCRHLGERDDEDPAVSLSATGRPLSACKCLLAQVFPHSPAAETGPAVDDDASDMDTEVSRDHDGEEEIMRCSISVGDWWLGRG